MVKLEGFKAPSFGAWKAIQPIGFGVKWKFRHESGEETTFSVTQLTPINSVTDFTGQRFDTWVVKCPVIVDGEVKWHCKHDNGKEYDFDIETIEQWKLAFDLTGQRFGTWVVKSSVIVHDELNFHNAVLKCQHDSGLERDFSVSQIEILKDTVDLIGQRFGNITVIEPDDVSTESIYDVDKATRKIVKIGVKNFVTWKCRCACGIELRDCHIYDIEKLKSMFSKYMCGFKCDFSCVVGKRFGHLKVLEKNLRPCSPDERNSKNDHIIFSFDKQLKSDRLGNKRKYESFSVTDDGIFTQSLYLYKFVGDNWHKTLISRESCSVHADNKCHCDCGNEIYLNDDELEQGSCGKCAEKLVGHRFGKLTVVELVKLTEQDAVWKCRCDCGNEVTKTEKELSSSELKAVMSCGCLESDIIGKHFNGWEIVEIYNNSFHICPRYATPKVVVKCCKCGDQKVVSYESLVSGFHYPCKCDFIGKIFGDFTVIDYNALIESSTAANATYKHTYLARCNVCGNKIIVTKKDFTSGDKINCDKCQRRKKIAVETTPKPNNDSSATELPPINVDKKKKPRTKDILKAEWSGIKQRCFNPNSTAYKSYGGRGITMYPEWVDDFQAFYDYLSQLENFEDQSYTLDRIDPNGNYEPANVRWADAKTQARNKRNTVFVDYYGEIIPIGEAAERCGIDAGVLYTRLRKNLKGDALFAPI